jgi:cysteine desulfurase
MHTGDPVYLDHNATTPVLPEVLECMLPYLRELAGDASSRHVFGRRARSAIERARAQTATLIGCEPDEIVFTSGGTEANNLALRGAAEAFLTGSRGGARRLITSSIEHPSVAAPCARLEQQGWKVLRLPVDRDGCVALEPLGDRKVGGWQLLSIMHSNHETGVLQPIAALAQAARLQGALVHTDAAQSIGKVPLDVRALDVDLLSIAGHKMYAPKGTGALYVKRGTALAPFTLGAAHEQGLRPGTENVAGIVGLGAACEIACKSLAETAERMRTLRDQLCRLLDERVPGLTVNGHIEHRLPNTLNVRLPGVSGTALLEATPEVAASTGSACHDGLESPCAVLLAMGLSTEEAASSVRLTLGRDTTARDIERASEALAWSWTRLRSSG